MRTGTHYFPRGVAAVERNRQKFGLNKIEETVGESVCTTSITANNSKNCSASNHRRTESCDLNDKRQTTSASTTTATTTILNSSNCNGLGINGATILSKEICNLMQTNSHSRMSPDLQRHLAYQTYRGFECNMKYLNYF